MNRTLLWVLACASSLLLAYEASTLIGSVWRPLLANPHALQTDFHYYDDAARRFSSGGALYLATDDVIAGFAYPPPAIVPFLALAKVPFGVALLALTLGSYAVLLLAIRVWMGMLRRHGFEIPTHVELSAMLIAIALGPSYMNAIFGQVNAFVLASAVGFFALAPPAAGAVFAVGILLKIYPALLAGTAVWSHRSRAAVAWGLLCAAIVIAALLPIIPWHTYVDYLDVLRIRGDKTAIHLTNQSLTAFIERFFYPPVLFLNWTGEQAVTVMPAIRGANLAAALAGLAWCWRRSQAGRHMESAAMAMALIAVIAPLGWGHTYVMVLPLVALHLVRLPAASAGHAIAIAASVGALMIPAGKRLGVIELLPAVLQNVVYSRYLLATVALMCLPVTLADSARPR